MGGALYSPTCIKSEVQGFASMVRDLLLQQGMSLLWTYVSCIKNTRIIARNHYSQIPPRKVLYPGVKSTKNGPSWAIMGHHGLFLTIYIYIYICTHVYNRIVYIYIYISRYICIYIYMYFWLLTIMLGFLKQGVR